MQNTKTQIVFKKMVFLIKMHLSKKVRIKRKIHQTSGTPQNYAPSQKKISKYQNKLELFPHQHHALSWLVNRWGLTSPLGWRHVLTPQRSRSETISWNMSLVSCVGIILHAVLVVGSTIGRSSNTGMALNPSGSDNTAMNELVAPVSKHLISGNTQTDHIKIKMQWDIYSKCHF